MNIQAQFKSAKCKVAVPLSVVAAAIILTAAVNTGAYASPTDTESDILYVADSPQDLETFYATGNAIRRYSVQSSVSLDGPSGAFIGPETAACARLTDPDFPDPGPASGALCGIGSIVIKGNKLLLGHNNAFRDPLPGEVLSYSTRNGQLRRALVAAVDGAGVPNPDAPYLPQNMVLWKGILFVADQSAPPIDDNHICAPADQLEPGQISDCPPGSIRAYDARTGKLLRKITPPADRFDPLAFHPRNVLIGPDGKLYVSVRHLPQTPTGITNFQLGGHVLRFNPRNGRYLGSFIDSDATNGLNRPQGMAFGPDGKFYLTSFRTDATDTDKILIFNGKTGLYVDRIDLAPPVATAPEGSAARAFAQDIVFGPGGHLYAPIFGPTGGLEGPVTGLHTGEIRSYDVGSKTYTEVIPAGGSVKRPSYVSFGKTDPATRAYRGD